jgi:hypothetical protein
VTDSMIDANQLLLNTLYVNRVPSKTRFIEELVD